MTIGSDWDGWDYHPSRKVNFADLLKMLSFVKIAKIVKGVWPTGQPRPNLKFTETVILL